MTKQRTQKALINIEYKVAKPFVDAAALAAGSSAFAFVLHGPVLNWGLLGVGFSCFWYWGSANLTRPKRRKKPVSPASVGAGSVMVNSVNGSRKVARGFNSELGYVSRETWWEILRRLVWGKDEPTPRPVIDKAAVPREFVFQSHYDGQPVEIREDDLRRFLRAAWKYRFRGVGLGERHWVREWRQRPQWYKDLGPSWWYKAVLALIGHAQQIRKTQLIVCTGPQWYALARDPHITLTELREAEAMKGHSQPVAPRVQTDDVLIIGTEGVSSFG